MASSLSAGSPPTTPLGPRPQFEFPVIHENPSGWGPCEVPEQFKDTPYQPFSKGDRLGKVNMSATSVLLEHTLYLAYAVPLYHAGT